MRRFSIGTVIALALIVAATTTMAQSKVVTFDYGDEGWRGELYNEIRDDGGEHGAYLNMTSVEPGGSPVLVGWYDLSNNSDAAFIGDYTEKGEVRICIDINVNFFDYYAWSGDVPAEEYREVAISLRDLDMQYVDPNYPNYPPYPYAEAQFFVNYLHSRADGWATYCADVTDVDAMELPEGWVGYGGGWDPNTYTSMLPPGYGWTDLLAGVDEIHINSLLIDWWYSFDFGYDIDVDNISIGPIPQYCAGAEATVFVDDNGMIHGGMFDGREYAGVLKGTPVRDIIVGTDGDDTITGFDGDDIICGMGGNDNLMGLHGDDFIDGGEGDDNLLGQAGNDFLTGGEGEDHLNGGPGQDTCLHGENVNNCGEWESNTMPARRTMQVNAMATSVESEQPIGFSSVPVNDSAAENIAPPKPSQADRDSDLIRRSKTR